MNKKLQSKYVKAAKENFEVEGEIEIDDNAVVSSADSKEGAYVQAWVWVPVELTKGDA